MDLVDVHRAVEQLALALLAAVSGITPRIAVQRADPAGGLRQAAGTEAIGIGFVYRASVGTADAEFISVALLGIDGKCLPDAVFQIGHRHIHRIPEIPVAGHTHALRTRRPDAENISGNAVLLRLMAAEEGVRPRFIPHGESLEGIVHCLLHSNVLLCPSDFFASVRRGKDASRRKQTLPFPTDAIYYTTLHKNFNRFNGILMNLSPFPFRLLDYIVFPYCTPLFQKNMRKTVGTQNLFPFPAKNPPGAASRRTKVISRSG